MKRLLLTAPPIAVIVVLLGTACWLLDLRFDSGTFEIPYAATGLIAFFFVYGLVEFVRNFIQDERTRQGTQIALSICISVLFAAFCIFLQEARYIAIVNGTVLIAICLSFILMHYDNLIKLNTGAATLKQIQGDLTSLRRFRNKYESIANSLLRSSPVVRKVGEKCLEKYFESFENRDGGFSVKGHYWSIESYKIFWRTLIEDENLKNCKVNIVHAGSERMWLDSDGMILLDLQMRFPGTIQRALIGNGPLPSEAHIEAMEEMIHHEVRVAYLNKADVGPVWYDFLWLEHEDQEFECAVIWLTQEVGGKVRRGITTRKVSTELKEMWHLVENGVEAAWKKSKIDSNIDNNGFVTDLNTLQQLYKKPKDDS